MAKPTEQIASKRTDQKGTTPSYWWQTAKGQQPGQASPSQVSEQSGIGQQTDQQDRPSIGSSSGIVNGQPIRQQDQTAAEGKNEDPATARTGSDSGDTDRLARDKRSGADPK